MHHPTKQDVILIFRTIVEPFQTNTSTQSFSSEHVQLILLPTLKDLPFNKKKIIIISLLLLLLLLLLLCNDSDSLGGSVLCHQWLEVALVGAQLQVVLGPVLLAMRNFIDRNVADSDIYITDFLTCLAIYVIFYLENYRLRKLKYHCLLITTFAFCGSENEIEQTTRKPSQICTHNISNRETLTLFL